MTRLITILGWSAAGMLALGIALAIWFTIDYAVYMRRWRKNK